MSTMPNHDQLSRDYLQTFLTAAGERVLQDLIDAHDGSPMVPGDPYATAYNVGKQDTVRYITDILNMAKEIEHNGN